VLILLLGMPAVAAAQPVQARAALISLAASGGGPVSNIGTVGDVIAGLSASGGTVNWAGFLGGASLGTVGVVTSPQERATFFAPPWPSPSLGSTSFRFGLAAPMADVRLEIYDVTGRLVATLVSGALPAGVHERRWDLRDSRGSVARAGVYFAQLAAGSLRQTHRLVILR
jgi:hypothetical protein